MRIGSYWLILAVMFCTIGPADGEDIAPGVAYTEYTLSGPCKVFVVSTDRWRAEYKLKVGWPQGKRNFTSRAATSTIASLYDSPPAHDVLAATNASFFDVTPIIRGAAGSDGEMLEHPDASYDTFLFGPARICAIREDLAHVEGTLTFANGTTTTLHDYNRDRTTDRIVAYTPQWGATTTTSAEGIEIILAGVTYPMRGDKEISGVVSAVRIGVDSINNPIPAGGMVIAARGTTVEPLVTANVNVGDRLIMRFDTNAGEYNNADMSISGVGWLVKDGVAYTSNWAQYSSSFVNNRNPRTAVGWSATHLHMVVVDGRSAASLGMSFQELASFLIGTLNCQGALNLDGGGSSTMWVNGAVRNVPSDGSQRSVANALMLVKQDTATALPFSDVFTATGRQAGWDDKFRYSPVIPLSPAAPGGDGHVVRVMDASGGVETMRRGDLGDSDYAVQADVYCEYRPSLAANGYERYGLFARDDGVGGFGLTTTSAYGAGNCYAMTYDTDNGRLRAGKFVNGTLTDFRESNPILLASTAWRRFRIECRGYNIRYLLDGAVIADVTDTTFTRGYYGVGFHERFTTNSNMHGTRADNFMAEAVGVPPGKAANPGPAHQAVGVATNVDLNWTAGSGTTSHRVHFGTTSPGMYRGTFTTTTWDPGTLVAGQTYYWRIDEVNTEGTATGDVWQFTALPELVLMDIDEDSDVDLDDFGPLQACLSGLGVAPTPECAFADFDGDTDVDMADLSAFVDCLSGAGLSPSAACGTVVPGGPIPPRPANAITGSQFVSEVLNFTLLQRDSRVLAEVSAGNIPDYLRTFVSVTVTGTVGGTPHTAVLQVAPDYLGIGSDADFIRMPMMPGTAQRIADRFECMLPTRKMVNSIYTAAAAKLAPSPINPSTTDITKMSTFYQHHQTIETQRAGQPLGLLIGGIKKDVVITPQLLTLSDRVAIYGWHQLNGTPIQPLYLGHNIYHVDYSHGIRLVSGYLTLDGVSMPVADVLRHPTLHVLLSDEGVVTNPRYPY